MKTDIHAHVGNYNAKGFFVSSLQGDRFNGKGVSPLIDVPNLLKDVRNSDMDKVVALAFDKPYDDKGVHYYVPNQYVVDLSKKHEEILAGISINPERPDAIDELEKYKNDAVLVKWSPGVMRFNPADKKHAKFYQKLAESGLPVLTHSGGESNIVYGGVKGLIRPHNLRSALDQGVKVIAAHCGAPEYFEEFLEMVIGRDNFYGDLSAMARKRRRGFLEKLAKMEEIHGKLLQGSDYPLPPENGVELIIQRDYEIKREMGFPESIATKFDDVGKNESR